MKVQMAAPGLLDNFTKVSRERREKIEQWFASDDGGKGLVKDES